MGCTNSVPDALDMGALPAMYRDPQDRLIVFDGNSRRKHDPAIEWAFVVDNDASEVEGGLEYYLINSSWLRDWKRFAAQEDPTITTFYNPIDNSVLVDEDDDYALSRTARFKKDYRVVDKKLWEFMFQAYGGGPVFLFFIPTGFTPESYKSGSWMKSANINSIVKVIYPRSRKDVCVSIKDSLPLQSSTGRQVAEDNASIAAGLFISNEAAAKIAEVAEAQKEADKSTSELVLHMLAKSDPKPTNEAEKLRYYARRLQGAWRRHQARKYSDMIRRKRAELDDACARLLQSRWRIKQARARVAGIKSRRMGNREAEAKKAVLVLQRAARVHIARLRLRKKQRIFGHVLVVNLMEYRPAGQPGSAAATIQVVLTAFRSPTEMKSVSTYITQPVTPAAIVEWNEQAIIGGYKGNDSGVLLVSIVCNNENGSVSVIGQELLYLKNYPLLHLFQPIDVNLKLKPYTYHIRDNELHNIYNEISTTRVSIEEHTKASSSGMLLMSISICPFAYSMCGWIERLSYELLSSKWKKRWFILCDMVLYYYDDPNDVGSLKGALDLGTVVSITEENKKGDICYELKGKTTDGADATWDIRFIESDPKDVVEMWKRKISRSCNFITGTNVFPTDIVTPRPVLREKNASMLGSFELKRSANGQTTEQHSVNAVRRMSYATASSGSFHKGGVSKKNRASIFGR